MSEFLAEARVVIRPDTTRFRAELLTAVATATKGVAVPINVVPTTSAAGIAALTAASQRAAQATHEVAGATRTKADADKSAAKAAQAHARQLGQVQTAALASAAGMTGLRGAVLTAGGAFLAATVAIQAFGKAVQSAAAFEQELNVFRVTTRATRLEMEAMREEAIALGRDISLPGVSSRDAAEAMTELARAGLSVEDSLAGARGVLQLAAAAQLDNAAATELAASALNAFNLAGEDTVKVADLLANAANEAQGGIDQIGLALQQSAAAASLAGVSLEDTVTVLTILARAGLRGSDAGTAFRVALLRLINPTKEARKEIERLGINLRDAGGNVRPEVFFELTQALGGVSRAQREATLATIFGVDAFRVAAIVGRESQASFDDLGKTLERQGAAAEIAGARAEGFSGKLEALQSNLETLGTSLGGVVLPPLGLFIDAMNELVTAASTASEAIQGLQRASGGLVSAFEDAVPGGERLVDVVQEIGSSLLGPQAGFVLTARGVNRLVGVFSDGADQIEGDATRVEQDVRRLFATFQESGGLGSATALSDFIRQLDEMADKLAKGDPAAQRLAGRIRALIKELQQPATFKLNLDLDFDENEINTATGAVTDEVTQSFINAGGAIKEVGLQWMRDLAAGMESGEPVVVEAATAIGATVQQTLSTEIAVAEARGDENTLLAKLRERERNQTAFLERVLARPQTQKNAALAERAAQNLAQTRREIQAIVDRQASEAARNAREAADKLSQADQDFIDGLNLEESRRNNALIAAQATARLDDDIRAQTALRNFYKRAVAEVRKTVNDAKLAAQIITGLIADQIRSEDEIEKLRKEQAEEQRRRRREARERQRESLALDVQIAEAAGNRGAEIRAREAEIAFLKEQIQTTRAGSNQRKRLILEIRRAEAELKELKGAKDEANKSAQQFFFEQLQAQQGFAANLLGNLITGPTAGLVGVPAPSAPAIPDLGARIGAEVGAATGRAGAVPTAGQANTEIDVLRRILEELKRLNGSYDAPEAIHQKKVGAGNMDNVAM